MTPSHNSFNKMHYISICWIILYSAAIVGEWILWRKTDTWDMPFVWQNYWLFAQFIQNNLLCNLINEYIAHLDFNFNILIIVGIFYLVGVAIKISLHPPAKRVFSPLIAYFICRATKTGLVNIFLQLVNISQSDSFKICKPLLHFTTWNLLTNNI